MRQFIQTVLEGVTNWIQSSPPPAENALVLSGGGARAAYQAGVLQYIAEAFPEAHFPILTGVSAGAVNAALLANHRGPFPEGVDHLTTLWEHLQLEQVMEPTSGFGIMRRLLLRGEREKIGEALPRQGIVDTAPFRLYLQQQLQTENDHLMGITTNVREGHIKAFAVVATNYGTGQTISWIQGRHITEWERPNRVGIHATITLDHIMASTALPFLFPAVQIGDAWYGDGSLRLSHPLAPAIYLGADRILAITTRYDRSRTEADVSSISGYPPAAQLFSLLMNAIFLDTMDQDILMLERINQFVAQLPSHKRLGFRPIRLLVIQPSQDLGNLASEYESETTGVIRLLARGLGSLDTKRADWLSMLLVVPEYNRRLMEMGHRDAAQQYDQIATFLAP